MAQYVVTGEWTEIYQVVVEADSPDEAEEKMSQMWSDGELFSNNGDWNVMVEEAE